MNRRVGLAVRGTEGDGIEALIWRLKLAKRELRLMLTLTLLFLAALTLFCVLIAAVHAMVGAKDFAIGWAVVALLIAVTAVITFAEGVIG